LCLECSMVTFFQLLKIRKRPNSYPEADLVRVVVRE
jgi:hypothetical protein